MIYLLASEWEKLYTLKKNIKANLNSEGIKTF